MTLKDIELKFINEFDLCNELLTILKIIALDETNLTEMNMNDFDKEIYNLFLSFFKKICKDWNI